MNFSEFGIYRPKDYKCENGTYKLVVSFELDEESLSLPR